jgi:hypothetical protein
LDIGFLQEFFGTPAGSAIILVTVLAVADFAFGVFAAFRDDVFQLDALAAWVRKHIMGRVAPILGTLFLGAALGGISVQDGVGGILSPGAVLTGVGILAATTYVLEVIGSIKESMTPKPLVREVPEE